MNGMLKTHDTHDLPARPARQAGTPGPTAQRAAPVAHGVQVLADGSPRIAQLKQLAALTAAGPAAAGMRHLQQMADNAPGVAQRREKPNDTGLPDVLKAGIESLSGMSMDHVKVHYNSDKPAQLQAHAYAQGSEIHLAPGQERHLPHEAWHLVQQAQGRVKATAQLKGMVALNDDAGLEAEADAMGAKALSTPPVQRQAVLQPGASTYGGVAQRVVSVSALKYIPAAGDLVVINALNTQIAQAETDASNDVQNNPAPAMHSVQQTAYMNNPTARAWGNCVEEKLNVWAMGNGWTIFNNSGGSNPDYSRMNGGTKIWADLTTAAEAGAGASHIIDKLDRKVASGQIDTGWVAADLVHNSLNPLAGGPPVAPVTNGVVTVAHRNAWQAYKSYQNRASEYNDLMARRIQQAERRPGYSTYTQAWTATRRDTFADWINGNNDANLPAEESEDDYSDVESDDYDSDDDVTRKKPKLQHGGVPGTVANVVLSQ